MENLFKQGSGIILLGFLCFALGSSAIEVVTAKEFNTTKAIHVRISNNHMPINSNGLMFVRVGTRQLQINCSIPSGSEKLVNISWRKSQNWLDGRSIELLRSNNTITLRLTIDQITWDLNGSIYWCGPRDEHIFDTSIKRSSVTIIIGNLPRPPMNIKHNIVDLRMYDINIYWTAATNVGRLPAYYNVTYIPCINRTYCQETPRYQFCTIPHISGKMDYKCNKLREEMKTLESLRDLYKFTIATVNPLGESKGPEFEINANFGGPNNAVYPTPRPPLSLNVFLNDNGDISMNWKSRELWDIVETRYTILYYKENDHKNKTIVVQGEKGQTMLTLREDDGIEPFTRYYFYITVEFLDSKNLSTGVSEPLGPRTIFTPEGEPEPGPDILNTSSSRYPHNTAMRNVTITWKVPLSSAWHGKPSHIKIMYYGNENYQDSKERNIFAFPNPPSQAVLTGLDSTVHYFSRIALCNSRMCGRNGEEARIKPIKGLKKVGKTDFTSNLTTYALIGVFIFIVTFILLAYCCFYKRKFRNKNPQIPLHDRIGDLEPYAYYEEVHNRLSGEDYDVPNKIMTDNDLHLRIDS